MCRLELDIRGSIEQELSPPDGDGRQLSSSNSAIFADRLEALNRKSDGVPIFVPVCFPASRSRVATARQHIQVRVRATFGDGFCALPKQMKGAEVLMKATKLLKVQGSSHS